jgi:hypothetical protein
MSSQFNPPPARPSGNSSMSTLTIVLIVMLVLLVPMCICGIVGGAALLLPAVQAGREAARIAKSSQNLRQIGVALHTYHDVWKTLPPAFQPDQGGQPGTSWRTAILPQLEQKPLFDQYDMSAAWNDPRNAAVVNTPLTVFQSPRDESRMANRTSYVVVRGPGTVFPGSQARDMASMTRGASQTILVLEIRNSDIAWAEPRDVDIDSLTTDPSAPNCVNMNAGVLALSGDGAVRTLRGMTLEKLKALVMCEGTESME